jgi:hypothetical protein
MNAGEFFGLVAAILGLLALVSILANLYRRNLDFKERKLELETQAATARASVPHDRNDLLEERVRVLERIATDRSPDLAIQIEALREIPRTEPALEERNN